MTYFRAWTLNVSAASANVPFAGRLKLPDETWVAAMRLWLSHLPCKETKRYVGNFLSVYRVRPTNVEDGNSDDSGVDEALVVTPATLPVAMQTSFRQTGKHAENSKRGAAAAMDDPLLASYQEAAQQAEAAWQAPPTAVPVPGRNPYEAQAVADTRQALKTIRKRGQTPTPQATAPTAGSWQAVAHDTVQKVDQFLVDINSSGKCNLEHAIGIPRNCVCKSQSRSCEWARSWRDGRNQHGGLAMGFARWTRHRQIVCFKFVALRTFRTLLRLAARC